MTRSSTAPTRADKTSIQHSVLVVDDDAQLRKFIARGLSRHGFTTVATESGADGISLLREQTFSAVVCDLHMPEVDGFDVLRFAGTQESCPPIIMLTGYGSVSVPAKRRTSNPSTSGM